MLVSVPRDWFITVLLFTSVFVPSHWSVVSYFWKSFFFLNFPVGIILLFSRSLGLNFLNPDLPVVWQSYLSELSNFFHFPCYVLNQLKRVTFLSFFLLLSVIFFLVSSTKWTRLPTKENSFFQKDWGVRGWTWKKSKWNSQKFDLKLLKLIILEQVIQERC